VEEKESRVSSPARKVEAEENERTGAREMNAFDITMRYRVFFGEKICGKIGEWLRPYKAKRVMLVTDPGILAAGLDALLLQGLREAGIEVGVFQDVEPNPTTQNVEDGTAFAKRISPDVMIGLGGGSSLDAGKAINILLTRGGRIRDYQGMVKDGSPLLPMIAIPTTAGTGSEVSPFLLISDSATHGKIVVQDIQALPDIAVLDPQLTVTLPRQGTILTGVDALVHGLEAFVAKGAQPYSQGLAIEAIQLIFKNLPEVVQNPRDANLRGEMLIASNLAGMAMATSYLGLAHSLANPLSRVAGMTHGMAVGLTISYVIAFNGPAAKTTYFRIARTLLGNACPTAPEEAILELASEIKNFLLRLGLPENLEDAGVKGSDLAEMSKEAMRQATVKSNPREPTLEDLMSLYEAAFRGRLKPRTRS
jgi:alcohol dehydrogenase